MTVADKILFTCSACQYRARIPGHYSGRSIHCPGCKTIQAVAAIEEAGGAPPAAPIAVAKLDTPAVGNPVLTTTPAAAPGANKIVFACTACSYKGRLAAEYDGKTIRCPGCQTAQVVKGTPAPAPIVASMAADETAFRGGDNEKIRFSCSACGYRARIPGKYADKPIHCPQCKQIQVAKAETDLEEATGRTVSISRVTPAAVKEPRLAMTNVGVQFHCAVCGFESKISPSCAGDAIYCPSCRAPQKVEWGDPAASAAPAPAAQSEAAPVAEAPAVVAPPEPLFTAPVASAPAPAPAANLDDLPLPGFDLEPAAAAPVSAPQSEDVSDVFAALPPAPEKPRAPSVVKKGSRRIVSAGGGNDDTAAPAPVAAAPAPAPVPAAPTSSAVVRARRSVPAPAKVDGEDSSSAHRPTTAAVAAPAVPHPAPSAPAKASKLPLVVLALLVVGLIACCAWLFLQIGDLKVKQDEAEQARKTSETARQTAEKDAKEKGEQLAAQVALAEKAKLEAEAALSEAKAAAEAALKEIEALKAAAPAAAPAGEVPAPAATPVLPAQ